MRYLLGLMCVVAALLASPLSVGAQAEEAGTTPEPVLPEPSSEPAPQEPTLQLKLDPGGVNVTASPPRTDDGYRLEEMDLRVRRARIGLLSTMGALLFGGMLIGIGVPQLDFNTGEGGALIWAGFAFATGGVLGMITTGGMLAHRKRKRRSLHEAHHGRPHRVQWDVARSRLVF